MLEEKLGYFFFDKKILSRALTRPSPTGEQGETNPIGQDQEAYFVVGSNLLQMVFAELLLREGYQTRGQIRDRIKQLAQQEKLATLSQKLGIGYRIKLSAGDQQQPEEDPLALAETLVAILGAVYFDGGFRTAREVTLRLFQTELPPGQT